MNKEITKKSLEAKFRCLCVRTKVDVRTHCQDLGGTSKLEPDPMHDLSCGSLRATDGRNGVRLKAINAMPLPKTRGP
ncbi:hypothetical protein PIB30_057725 [Stylosanthes scabra]|uniref:Uncharacterized protein n=1 Tax=Stylosanthes scabra TaxID=79078 RepID=A0ABU6RK20_9FABA|nr:hypothetical protein [Stylosanthes scabra]